MKQNFKITSISANSLFVRCVQMTLGWKQQPCSFARDMAVPHAASRTLQSKQYYKSERNKWKCLRSKAYSEQRGQIQVSHHAYMKLSKQEMHRPLKHFVETDDSPTKTILNRAKS